MLSSLPPVPPPFPGASFQGQVSPRVQTPGSAAAEPEAPTSGARSTEASGKSESARENPESKAGDRGGDNPQGLSEQELKQLTELKARDREVRAHEAAHQAVGGQYAGAMSFTYQRGPDGAQYAVGGEVSIDLSPVQGDPQATIEKMRIVRAAAMAPAEPSGQDRAVAAQAMQIMLQAQSELAAETGASSRTASDAYREVSAMGESDQSGDENRVSSFQPVSA
ncbi:SprA-related family protein [Marinobacter sp. DSM 26671]|uniref:putative metalloprotease CJM1_0395 family protein n=1 Tax=Marinobacter sp. DSM 26671 TaxID=1761793 RepID=UPI0008DF349A|nr:putative metalloprotease CJM1_0395 family protein [Marinobacter sp. DSM 26671]SFE25275.1 SprA-related family protein [Marinobacter sp. DSM 26671]